MPDEQSDHGDEFTTAFLELHRRAGKPRASHILERAANMRLVDRRIAGYGKPPADSTIDDWIRNKRIPRSETKLLLVVAVLAHMAEEREGSRTVPAHLTAPEAWRRRLTQKRQAAPSISSTDYPGTTTEESSEWVGKDFSAKKVRFTVLIPLGTAVIATATAAVLLVANRGTRDKDEDSRIEGKSTSIEYTDSRQALVKVVAVTPRLSDANSWTYKKALTLSNGTLSRIGDPGSFGNSLSRYDKWFLDHDAVPVSDRADQIVLEGNSRTPVRVIDIEVNKQCHPPLAGSIFDNPGAGADDSTTLGVDLDRPMQVEESGPQAEPGPYFDRHTISLKYGEQHVLVLRAGTSKFYCEYTLGLKISRNGEILTQVVKNNGVPFRVSAGAGDSNDRNPYKGYVRAYIAGIPSFYACPSSKGKLIRVDPMTYTIETKKCP
ncbi:hypothetical protein OG889_22710 [Streptomyces sp. NBC_00481]|uniref:hypothetical protein n=1 Tax=unclassified Streptomyces TaxID=2593676 RepID=UPI002DD8EF47|nr:MULTISPECIES: hypothetical protein [unclassified Streptomyces]WRY97289.1 hypothetical protein OG889_22710 [Streptomyces sp. NBC_00481]